MDYIVIFGSTWMKSSIHYLKLTKDKKLPTIIRQVELHMKNKRLLTNI